MADFAAVLKKTIDGQAHPTPELRQRVYAKARATIEQKLVSANAPAAVANRQRKALEEAIGEVEAQYETPEIDEAPEVIPQEPVAEEPAVEENPVEETAAAEETSVPEAEPVGEAEQSSDPLEEFLRGAQPAPIPSSHTMPDFTAEGPAASRLPVSHEDDPVLSIDRGERDEWRQDRAEEDAFARAAPYEVNEERRGPVRGLILGLIALLVLGGIGYAAWSNTEQLQTYMTGIMDRFNGSGDVANEPAPAASEGQPAEEQQPAPADTTPAPPPENDASQQPAAQPKLTQRLMPDGSEVDPGPAGDKPGVGEGTSVTASSDEAQPQKPAAVPVGQQAFFYEERSGQDAGSAKKGSVVWSVVQESPGEGEPEEPAIRADVTVPEGNLNLRMLIRRNTDKSLPASHLIEMIFTVPDDFAGGAIDNVQRVTFKDTEQSAGSPLIAIPAKIADNFFIVALNDARTAVDTNMTLMRRQQWIDIPITYRTGRRALITVEKGVPGDKVFDEVLKDWSNTGNGDGNTGG
ncbi:transcriptional regulator [Phyllobacterium phragmitis]|uniref:Transcriptional regulator n=1 Tax=Phyllobacterium phragmitis TaxID=2670329 RepID=A0A2S9ITX1_9HYPH|nr:transcriptional regulator [Phyllobacterium phragmitis]PRD43977.1 transcriptional regulator [Phyllobacterium phragmitis]